MRRRIAALALLVAVVLALVVQVRADRLAELRARELYVAAGRTSRALEERLRDAEAAAVLQPRVIAYRQRAASISALLDVESGRLDEARKTLIAAWALDRSAMYLREQLRNVNMLIFARDSRKAHVLHGREGPGGELEPEDLLP